MDCVSVQGNMTDCVSVNGNIIDYDFDANIIDSASGHGNMITSAYPLLKHNIIIIICDDSISIHRNVMNCDCACKHDRF